MAIGIEKLNWEKIKSFFWNAIVGAILISIVGFNWWGWVLESTAQLEAKQSAEKSVIDRLAKIFEATGDEHIISWLCQKADGFYCPNPKAEENATKDLFAHTQKLVSEFSDILQVVSASYSGDGVICEEDSKKIRGEWEELKSVGESFLKACEKGNFA